MTRIEYLVCSTTDPHSSCLAFKDLTAARQKAVEVGHFHCYEYEITPGIPGVEPDKEELVANHYQVTNGTWNRDAVQSEDEE